jgi:hypothetical protein
MSITYKTRNFHPDELRLLKTLKTQKEKETISKIKFYHFIIAGLLGAGLTYVVTTIPDSFWTFLFGTIAVFAFAFIVFTPYEIYKQKNRHKLFLRQLSETIERDMVETCLVNTKRIAIAPEYEDESDLYIVELNDNEVLYLWDSEYNLNKKFPCLDFEIYEDNFFKLIGRQIYPLSEKIQPVQIDKKRKWNYMKQYGASGHLEIEKIDFDELLTKYNNCA